MLIFLLLFSSLFQLSPDALAKESTTGDHIRVRVLAPETFSATEESLIGVYFEPDPKWHVYWKNSGDSGAAPKFKFETQNAEVGPIQWPAPVRLPIAHLTNLGYEGAVAYLFSVKAAKAESLSLTIDLEWLVCKEDCIPGFDELQIERPIGDGPPKWESENLALIQKFASRLPASSESAPFEITSLSLEGDELSVQLASSDATLPEKLDLFPVEGFVSPSTPQWKAESQSFVFKTSPSLSAPESFSFVASAEGGAWEFQNLSLSPGTPAATDIDVLSLLLLVLSAALGGLLLNLMPCVFPVISIKAFALLKAESSERVKDCLLYSCGVILTFSLLGGLFLVLRQLGAAVGWGFQLQSPLVIFSLILLFWLLALNFLGVYSFGDRIMNQAGRYAHGSSSFGTGVLSVFVAAPCTGPFMGTALGAAASLSAPKAFLIFFALGIGLALPFLFFALVPRSLGWLPKPGAWMERAKEFFAFPLFATVVWLCWVLGQQIGSQGWFFTAMALLAISFALWLGRSQSKVSMALAWGIAVFSVAAIAIEIPKHQASAPVETSAWQTYDEKELEAARQQGQPVFVDFTAAWCITCQVNKQAVLDTEAAQTHFREAEILLMRADWTNYDDRITKALARLNRNSVPVYAYYPEDGSEPILLPQILSLSMIENLKPKTNEGDTE